MITPQNGSASPNTRTTLGRFAKLLLLPVITVLAACDPEIAPPGGEFTEPVTVTITVPNATDIFYTLDGSDPEQNCLLYTSPFEVSSTTVVKAQGWDGDVKMAGLATETYLFDDTSSGTSYTNGDMLAAWSEYETDTRQIFADRYFDGCEPVKRCDGQLNLDDMKTYTICDVDSSIADTATCEAAGGGWITWTVLQEGLGGGSVFVYNNFDYMLSSGNTLKATGSIVGHFDSNGTGSTNTSEGETIRVSGAFEGNIDDAVSVTNSQKTGGSYTTQCSAAGCAPTAATYILSAGPTFTLVPPATPSCEPVALSDTYRIQLEVPHPTTGTAQICVSRVAEGTAAEFKLCEDGASSQQWEIFPDDSTEAADDYKVKIQHANKCLAAFPETQLNQNAYTTAECQDGLAAQRFTFSEDLATGKYRLNSTADHFPGFDYAQCISYKVPFASSKALVTAIDCDLPFGAPSFGLDVVNISVDPSVVINPMVDLLPPLEPVTFDLTNRAGDNHSSSIVIPSPIHNNLTATFTAQNNNESAKKVSASNLEGFGVYTSGANLNGIQTNEQLVITFDQPVDISNLTFRQWEGPDQIKVRWEGTNFVITDDSDGFKSEESVDVDMKGVTWIALKGDSFLTVTYLKSLTVTPTVH